jgi:glyoxylase-like metal-dependent hydrolase (beta-lactamase superfamily II)
MKITDKVYMLDEADFSHVFLVYTPEPVLIDTGMPFQRKKVLRALNHTGVKLTDIKHIIFTHHDVDHIGNAVKLQELTGAKLWASAEDIPYITGEKQRHSFKKYIGKMLRHKPTDIYAFTGDKIYGIEVVPTPGHTPGHVCFLFDGVLFAGDLLENKKGSLIPYPASWDWDYDKMLESVKKIASCDFKWVCPAHGSPILRGEQPILTAEPSLAQMA